MSGKVYIDRVKDGVRFAETDSAGRLIRYLLLSDDEPVGSIYRGKVVRNIGVGSFVDIGRERHAFLSADKRPGDFVTVCVTRGEDGEKGCRLTERLSISGRLVIAFEGDEVRFSRKSVLSSEQRHRLSETVSGVLFRTAVNDNNLEEALAEAAVLRARLAEIERAADNLYEIKPLFVPDMLTVAENMSDAERGDFKEIENELQSVFERKILVGNVELVFDKTEAMTVIDVNSHLNTDFYSDAEACAYATNLIAAEELCRQIRLRNIGGLIAVDFVSLKKSDNVEALKRFLENELKKDDVRSRLSFSDDFCVALISRTKRYGL